MEESARDRLEDFEVKDWLLADGEGKTGAGDESNEWMLDASTPENQGGELVLVVDDLADMRTLIRGVLVESNHRVVTASNGKEAWRHTSTSRTW